MIRMRKMWFLPVICFLISLLIFVAADSKEVKASTVTIPTFSFQFNTQVVQTGVIPEMKTPEAFVSITSNPWDTANTVTWVSSETGVVTIEPTSIGPNYVKVIRKGPGFSTITAIVKNGSFSNSYSFVVKVALTFDYAKTGMTLATTTNERILIMDTVGQEKQVYLKYVDYDDTAAAASGSAITVTGSAISATAVLFESSNESVATIDSTGKVKAVGSGHTIITVSSTTMSSSDKPMVITMNLVVAPKFSVTFPDSTNTSHTYNSVDDFTDSGGTVSGVPSSFVINSNSIHGNFLKWVVVDFETKKTIAEGTSSKMTYSVSTISGNVTFTGVKAGTYEIYAFADTDYNQNTNAPYAYMKVIVPIDLGDTNLIMNVGDTYNVLENSNLPYIGVFSDVDYTVGNANIASFDESKYIITAKRKGNVSITLTYDTGLDLFDTGVLIPTKTINITVIDGIALSTTTATLYTKGTLYLDAIVSDNTSAITWTSSDTSIATVVNGLVTGVKAGTAVITAKQTVDGVVKKATCTIVVQQSVTSITVDPSTLTLGIDTFKTLHATITPGNLSGINLQWKSSNNNIVTIVEASGNTATIQGVAGGHAVISAINQDNVVVGYCHVSVQQPVTSITLSETAATVDLTTKKLQLRAMILPENALNKNVNWSTTDASKATVDANGMVTLLKSGSVSIIATSADNPSARAICNLTITVPVLSIALDETTKVMYSGQSARLTYVILPTNASNAAVNWTSTNASVASVDSTGKVTAKGTGSAVIILRTVDGGFSVFCAITVKKVATAVKLDVSKLDLKTGGYYYIKTTLTPKDSTDNGLVWESSDTKVATVDDDGKVVAKDAGSAIIMVRTEAGGVAYCQVNVTQPVASLMLNFSEKTIFKNTKFNLEVSITPSTASNLTVNWKTSNAKIASVTKNGEVTGLTGGTAIITCTTVDGGFIATCVVTVREPVTKVTLDYETYNLGIGKTFKLTATVSTDTATNQGVIWTSSNDAVATVNQKGKVTGKKAGYATITAMALDGSEVEASCEVRIVTPVESVTINDNYVTLFVGEVSNLKATIRPKNATYKTAVWTSSDPSVAIVDDDGVVTALKAGTTTISATTQDNSGKKAICLIAVYDRVPSTGITLQDKKLTMVAGEDKIVQLVLIPATSTDSYSWSTDNPAVATVNKTTGKITAKSTGTAYISVMTDSGKTSTVEVTVIGLNYTKISLEQYTDYSDLVVEGATTTVKWTSDNPQVAIIRNGSIISTKAVGTTYITATVNGRKLKCKLTVTKLQ